MTKIGSLTVDNISHRHFYKFERPQSNRMSSLAGKLCNSNPKFQKTEINEHGESKSDGWKTRALSVRRIYGKAILHWAKRNICIDNGQQTRWEWECQSVLGVIGKRVVVKWAFGTFMTVGVWVGAANAFKTVEVDTNKLRSSEEGIKLVLNGVAQEIACDW